MTATHQQKFKVRAYETDPHGRFEPQIDFLSECHQGQTIASISQTIGDARGTEVRHEIARREDGEPAARAKTVWRSPD